MRPEDFDFPRGVLAKKSNKVRSDCKLMVADRAKHTIKHYDIRDLPEFLSNDEVWVNDSYAPGGEKNVYSFTPGSHVLPSAGYFLSEDLVSQLNLKTLTLHIGSPSEQLIDGFKTNIGWDEPYWMQKQPVKQVAAIGTTVVKALETWALTGKTEGRSTLFIQPPFEFKIVKKFLTNFHYPKESLLALTCAFGGIDLIREAYEVAVRNRYLFSDFGDRLLII